MNTFPTYFQEYVKVELDKSASLFSLIFKPNTSEMEDHEFKIIILWFIQIVQTHRPQYFYLNTFSSRFLIDIPLQEWVATQFKKHKIIEKFKRIAITLPQEDLIVRISTEQLLEEIDLLSQHKSVRLFFDELHATNWLLKEEII